VGSRLFAGWAFVHSQRRNIILMKTIHESCSSPPLSIKTRARFHGERNRRQAAPRATHSFPAAATRAGNSYSSLPSIQWLLIVVPYRVNCHPTPLIPQSRGCGVPAPLSSVVSCTTRKLPRPVQAEQSRPQCQQQFQSLSQLIGFRLHYSEPKQHHWCYCCFGWREKKAVSVEHLGFGGRQGNW
jgi:hypothetical protein